MNGHARAAVRGWIAFCKLRDADPRVHDDDAFEAWTASMRQAGKAPHTIKVYSARVREWLASPERQAASMGQANPTGGSETPTLAVPKEKLEPLFALPRSAGPIDLARRYWVLCARADDKLLADCAPLPQARIPTSQENHQLRHTLIDPDLLDLYTLTTVLLDPAMPGSARKQVQTHSRAAFLNDLSRAGLPVHVPVSEWLVEQVWQACALADPGYVLQVRARAALALGLSFGLPISALARLQMGRVFETDDGEPIRLDDVDVRRRSISACLCEVRSEANVGERHPLIDATGELLCPVFWTRHWLQVRGAQPGALFLPQDGSVARPETAQLSHAIGRLVDMAGLALKIFEDSPVHSAILEDLRRGASHRQIQARVGLADGHLARICGDLAAVHSKYGIQAPSC